jgi:hypothetical protein
VGEATDSLLSAATHPANSSRIQGVLECSRFRALVLGLLHTSGDALIGAALAAPAAQAQLGEGCCCGCCSAFPLIIAADLHLVRTPQHLDEALLLGVGFLAAGLVNSLSPCMWWFDRTIGDRGAAVGHHDRSDRHLRPLFCPGCRWTPGADSGLDFARLGSGEPVRLPPDDRPGRNSDRGTRTGRYPRLSALNASTKKRSPDARSFVPTPTRRDERRLRFDRTPLSRLVFQATRATTPQGT